GNYLAPGGSFSGGDSYTALVRRKIWVSAIDMDHGGKLDPSHPPFYLPGQPMEADSHRPFAALEPCRALGATCESGADCCDGFCPGTGNASDGTPILECVPPPPNACSQLDEFCLTAKDCCDPNQLCILNRCAIPTPPVY